MNKELVGAQRVHIRQVIFTAFIQLLLYLSCQLVNFVS